MINQYDEVLRGLSAAVGGLSRRAQTALFALCGEALQPLFEQFHRESGWGDPTVLEQGLSSAWRFAFGGRPIGTDLLDELGANIPHGDDFDSPSSTFAQDAVICIDAAVRAAAGTDVDPMWIEYALEPSTTAAALTGRGLVDVGSSAEDEAWRSSLLENPLVAEPISFLREATSALGQWDVTDRESTISTLRARAAVLLPPATPPSTALRS